MVDICAAESLAPIAALHAVWSTHWTDKTVRTTFLVTAKTPVSMQRSATSCLEHNSTPELPTYFSLSQSLICVLDIV